METIAPVRPTDATEIAAILQASRERAEYPIGPNWTLEQVRSECTKFGLALKSDGRVEAFVLARDVGAAIEISMLATATDARGQGKMERLLRDLTARLEPQKAIWLEVHEANEPARKLYEKCGFKKTGTRPKYYADGGAAVLYNYG